MVSNSSSVLPSNTRYDLTPIKSSVTPVIVRLVVVVDVPGTYCCWHSIICKTWCCRRSSTCLPWPSSATVPRTWVTPRGWPCFPASGNSSLTNSSRYAAITLCFLDTLCFLKLMFLDAMFSERLCFVLYLLMCVTDVEQWAGAVHVQWEPRGTEGLPPQLRAHVRGEPRAVCAPCTHQAIHTQGGEIRVSSN